MYSSSYKSLKKNKEDGYEYAIVQQDGTGIIGFVQLIQAESETEPARIVVHFDSPEGSILMTDTEFSRNYNFIRAIHTHEEYDNFLEKFDSNKVDPVKMAATVRDVKDLVYETLLKWHKNFYGKTTTGSMTEEFLELQKIMSNLKKSFDMVFIGGRPNFEEFSKFIWEKIYLNSEM